MSAKTSGPISAAEADALFGDLADARCLVLAVSGGPDSTALLWLAARWRKKTKTKLVAVTVDHGLRKEAKREAAAVGRLAKRLGVPHRILKWTGAKPKTGVQQAARQARYALLVKAAKKAGATHILTAHTLDDQAETVLMRMARGSGIAGLGGMERQSRRLDGLILVRPFLDVPKARLIATLKAAQTPYAEDPSNGDPRFTRARLRPLMASLAVEGLDARRLGTLAQRLQRADAALEAEVDRVSRVLPIKVPDEGAITFPAHSFARLPAEIGLRLFSRVIDMQATEGLAELGKQEALFAAVQQAVQKPVKTQFRRTLAGALVTLAAGELRVENAPPRRRRALTKRGKHPARWRKAR